VSARAFWVHANARFRSRKRAFFGAALKAVHPLSIEAFQLNAARWLGPGAPVSPEEGRLRLLPSGPDRVHDSPPTGTRPSTPRDSASPTKLYLEREFNPAMRIAGAGHRKLPI
jgi:hypothetical protein